MSITFSPELFIEDTNEFMDALESVNVSNQNARFLLENLGLEFDYSGTFDPELFMGAITAVAPVDEGRPASDMPGPGMQVIDGGRRAGYLQERLLDLMPVVQHARELGRQVQWG